MNEIKSVLTSRTVWSGLLAMAAGIAAKKRIG